MAMQTTVIGQSIPRLESNDKATGRAEYIHTMRLPGMLHAKVFRSDTPHGRILSIDTAEAAALPLSLFPISDPTRLRRTSLAAFAWKKKTY